MNRALNKFLWASWGQVAKHAAEPYTVGSKLENAVAAARRLAAKHLATTVCYWNTPDESPEDITAKYLDTINAFCRERLEFTLSLKARALGFDRARVMQVLESGEHHCTRQMFDALGPEEADDTFQLIDSTLARFSHVGCTLPGRWRRSVADADWAVERNLSVRVVKGQWADLAKPEVDLREGYLAVIRRLAGRARHVSVATHDAGLAEEAIRRLLETDTPCELELLSGLPTGPALRVAQKTGVKVRFYIPYGHAWLPYNLSQVYENPRILWWMLRDVWAGGLDRLPA